MGPNSSHNNNSACWIYCHVTYSPRLSLRLSMYAMFMMNYSFNGNDIFENFKISQSSYLKMFKRVSLKINGSSHLKMFKRIRCV
jgi:hypothetical protein